MAGDGFGGGAAGEGEEEREEEREGEVTTENTEDTERDWGWGLGLCRGIEPRMDTDGHGWGLGFWEGGISHHGRHGKHGKGGDGGGATRPFLGMTARASNDYRFIYNEVISHSVPCPSMQTTSAMPPNPVGIILSPIILSNSRRRVPSVYIRVHPWFSPCRRRVPFRGFRAFRG